MNHYCELYWSLYDIYCRLQDDKNIDPKAVERAKIAIEKHRRECAECKRSDPDVPLVR